MFHHRRGMNATNAGYLRTLFILFRGLEIPFDVIPETITLTVVGRLSGGEQNGLKMIQHFAGSWIACAPGLFAEVSC